MLDTTVHQIAQQLLRRQWTIAVAESVTAGRIQALLTSLSGASEYFVGGLTAYSIEQKVRLLNVDRQHAQDVNCVSPRVCEEMALGVVNLFMVDVALAITGYAEPDQSRQIARPFAYVGIWLPSTEHGIDRALRLSHLKATGTRDEVQASFAQQSVAYLSNVLACVGS